MKQKMTLAGIFLAAAFCLASCNDNNQAKQNSDLNEQETESQETPQEASQETPQERTFRTNKGDIPYERAVNYCYQLGYEHGNDARTNPSPQYSRSSHMDNFKSLWTGLYGVPTSTEESREAYKACFEEYKRGHDESFYGTDDL